MRAVFSSKVDCCQLSTVSFLHLSLTIAWVITTSRWARKLDHSISKKEGGGKPCFSDAELACRLALYREENSSFSGPTPQSLGVCAAFFCDQARSNWDSVTSATQFHCPKLYCYSYQWITGWQRRLESWSPSSSSPWQFVLHALRWQDKLGWKWNEHRHVHLALPPKGLPETGLHSARNALRIQ